jgi:hypothetical protein
MEVGGVERVEAIKQLHIEGGRIQETAQRLHQKQLLIEWFIFEDERVLEEADVDELLLKFDEVLAGDVFGGRGEADLLRD